MEHVKFTRKFIVCLLAGLLMGAVIRRALAVYFVRLIPMTVIWAFSLLIVFAFVEYAFMWHRQEKKGKVNSPERLARLHVWMAYALAFDLASFGWQKIGHLQMVVPLGMLDEPFNQLDSETLTWAYFRRSYPFTVSIAICQMGSAYLLLWARTRLTGLIVMVPILLNIILIDILYHLHTGVLVHAIILMTVVIYLLMQSYSRLVAFFFREPDTTRWAPVKKYTANIWRAAVVLTPVVLLATYTSPDKHPQFTGKYRVQQLKINGVPAAAHNVRDSVLTTVYMDLQDDFILEFNHYKSRYFGTYSYNAATDSIQVQWRYPRAFKAPFAGILKREEGHLFFQGELDHDTISMRLEKVPEP